MPHHNVHRSQHLNVTTCDVMLHMGCIFTALNKDALVMYDFHAGSNCDCELRWNMSAIKCQYILLPIMQAT